MDRYEFIWSRRGVDTHHLSARQGGRPLSFREVFERWYSDPGFTEKYVAALLVRLPRGASWVHRIPTAEGPSAPYVVCVTPPETPQSGAPDLDFLAAKWQEGRTVLTFRDEGQFGTFVAPNRTSSTQRFYDLSTFLTYGGSVLHTQLLGAVGLLAQQRYITSVETINPTGSWLQVWVGRERRVPAS